MWSILHAIIVFICVTIETEQLSSHVDNIYEDKEIGRKWSASTRFYR